MAIRGEAFYRGVDEECHQIQEELEKAMSNHHELIKEEKCMHHQGRCKLRWLNIGRNYTPYKCIQDSLK
jgi:hypothetical protein